MAASANAAMRRSAAAPGEQRQREGQRLARERAHPGPAAASSGGGLSERRVVEQRMRQAHAVEIGLRDQLGLAVGEVVRCVMSASAAPSARSSSSRSFRSSCEAGRERRGARRARGTRLREQQQAEAEEREGDQRDRPQPVRVPEQHDDERADEQRARTRAAAPAAATSADALREPLALLGELER